ncbi:MAG TPA: carbon-phosphorus lyase complex subunit PhnJ [Bacillus bacterium]|uniref:Carbon-phosphorus lyase complex subunit PhnJ n=1 Tax=Siminovitchia fordii TaxID=254759 RepID=A0ABQ4KAL3_9BACI|nr:alpha-D-ribose 1-methylphosphonate 5-phosphate C-P-lyase PhnJ [Siminovitchia fordii]GIN21913.1 carbon-phosphorus lyase complex subunit PhnJ [Siminovitchia fordii]HBZ11795.1 carbon-phosphorus lyase complex subunit PhnJ [Bacillus sp. (in: firmicutes)]
MENKPHFALLDEGSKKEIRRAILKAVAIPGYQVPFASREMPIARGWGTGGLQITLSIIGKEDVLKVIDQGADESVNAVNIKKLVNRTTGIKTTTETRDATIIQSRHRIPEVPLTENQMLVLQVPIPEPLRWVEPSEWKTKQLHAENEYSGAWLMLFEQIMKYGKTATNADHPVLVHNRYVMAPSPIPRFDNIKMNQSESLILLGAGREKKIYAVPPYTKVVSLAFEDHAMEVESFEGKHCHLCHSTNVFLDELVHPETNETYYQCNDTSYCLATLNKKAQKAEVTVENAR